MTTTLPEAFNPEEQEGTSFDLLPVGEYVAQIIDASVSQRKTGDGYGINLMWQITEGEYENRYVWQRITFQHSSNQAQTIGRKQLKDLCDATGFNEPVSDADVFKFIPCRIRVGIEKDKNGIYPDKNKVARVLPLEPPPETQPAKPAVPKPGPKPEAAKAPRLAKANSGKPRRREPRKKG
jgi:hypothetical protein